MAGSMRQLFGVCTNEYSPSDGRVVSFDHGCGAHSEVAVVPGTAGAPDPVVDEIGFDLLATDTLDYPLAAANDDVVLPGDDEDALPGEDDEPPPADDAFPAEDDAVPAEDSDSS
jgi:hypothetical protein